MDFNAIYLPVGVPTFHLESAEIQFKKSIEILKSIDESVAVPDKMLLSVDDLKAFIRGKRPDLIIFQNLTFANAAYMSEILGEFSEGDILLWTLREPVIDGTRLRLNSLTGAFSAANTMRDFSRSFEYVYGSPDEEEVKNYIKSVFAASKAVKALKSLKILQIGHTPQGFGFGRAMDNEMKRVFGSTLISIESRELIDRAKSYTDEDISSYAEDAKRRICGLEAIDKRNASDFARLYKAYFEYVKENGVGALSSRCWPDFFTSFGTPVCAVLSILNDLGVPSSCEADTYGALSMYVCHLLSGMPVFFGDPVSLDEGKNTITFWHCGMAPCSLAKDGKAYAGVHCNRKIGPTLEFVTGRAKEATVFRIGKDNGSFRFLILKGEVADSEKQFYGTSAVVKLKGNAKKIVSDTVREGYEPHFVVAMKDISGELNILARFLGIKAEII